MRASSHLLYLGLGALLLVQEAFAYKTGDGTAYSGDYDKDATGFNSCGFGRLPDYFERYYAAIPSFVFNRNQHCGRCIKVRGIERGAPGRWVKVMIVDECASCRGSGDVDLSTRALNAATGFSWDRKRIEWEWTSCSGDDGVTQQSLRGGGGRGGSGGRRRRRRRNRRYGRGLKAEGEEEN